jgi:osmotically-inducible protein OsmY
MRRFTSVLLGAAVAAVVAYLFDPDRGRSRRARLADQAAAGLRDAKETVKAKAEYQQGVFKGAVHDVKEVVTADDQFSDEKLLEKVRSEAVGRLNGSTSNLEIDITDGTVRLSGSLESAQERERLLELISKVEGVAGIDDQTRIQ